MLTKKGNNFQLENSQKKTANTFWFLALVFVLPTLLPHFEKNPLTGIWGISFLGFFFTISCVAIAFIFKKRAKKMNHLIDGSKLLFEWKLDDDLHKQYVTQLWRSRKGESKLQIRVISIFFVIVSIPFLFILEGKEMMTFLSIFLGIWFIIAVSANFFPWYYKMKNLKGDKQILIGKNYAYINGYFHNWDFPLSGMEKIKAIQKPFVGIELIYYYTDRTLKHSHKLQIPTPKNLDNKEIAEKLLQLSKK